MARNDARSRPAREEMTAGTSSPARTATGDLDEAADHMVATYGAGDVPTYVACFAEDATVILDREPSPLGSRHAFREVLEEQAARGARIIACHEWGRHLVRLAEEVAAMTHVLSTHLEGDPLPIREQETLIFSRQLGGDWLVVHLHRSRLHDDWGGPRRAAAP